MENHISSKYKTPSVITRGTPTENYIYEATNWKELCALIEASKEQDARMPTIYYTYEATNWEELRALIEAPKEQDALNAPNQASVTQAGSAVVTPSSPALIGEDVPAEEYPIGVLPPPHKLRDFSQRHGWSEATHGGAITTEGELALPWEYPPGLTPPPGLVQSFKNSTGTAFNPGPTSSPSGDARVRTEASTTGSPNTAGSTLNAKATEFVMPTLKLNAAAKSFSPSNANVTAPGALLTLLNSSNSQSDYPYYGSSCYYGPSFVFASNSTCPSPETLAIAERLSHNIIRRVYETVEYTIASSNPCPSPETLAAAKQANHDIYIAPYQQCDYLSTVRPRNDSTSTEFVGSAHQGDDKFDLLPSHPVAKKLHATLRKKDLEVVTDPLLLAMFAAKSEEDAASERNSNASPIGQALFQTMVDTKRAENAASDCCSTSEPDPKFSLEVVEAQIIASSRSTSPVHSDDPVQSKLTTVIDTHRGFRETFGLKNAQILLDDSNRWIFPKPSPFFNDEQHDFSKNAKKLLQKYQLSQQLGLDLAAKPSDWSVRPRVASCLLVDAQHDDLEEIIPQQVKLSDNTSGSESDQDLKQDHKKTNASAKEGNNLPKNSSLPSSSHADSVGESLGHSSAPVHVTEPTSVVIAKMQDACDKQPMDAVDIYNMTSGLYDSETDVVDGNAVVNFESESEGSGPQNEAHSDILATWKVQCDAMLPSEDEEEDEIICQGAADDLRSLNLQKMEAEAEQLTIMDAPPSTPHGRPGRSPLCAELHFDGHITISEKPLAIQRNRKSSSCDRSVTRVDQDGIYLETNPNLRNIMYRKAFPCLIRLSPRKLLHRCAGDEFCAMCFIEASEKHCGPYPLNFFHPSVHVDSKWYHYTGRFYLNQPVYYTFDGTMPYIAAPPGYGYPLNAEIVPQATNVLVGFTQPSSTVAFVGDFTSGETQRENDNPYGYPEKSLADLIRATTASAGTEIMVADIAMVHRTTPIRIANSAPEKSFDNGNDHCASPDCGSPAIICPVPVSPPIDATVFGTGETEPSARDEQTALVPFYGATGNAAGGGVYQHPITEEELKELLKACAKAHDTALARELDPEENVINAPRAAPERDPAFEADPVYNPYEVPELQQMVLYDADSPTPRKILNPKSRINPGSSLSQAVVVFQQPAMPRPTIEVLAIAIDEGTVYAFNDSEDEEDDDDSVIFIGDDGAAVPAEASNREGEDVDDHSVIIIGDDGAAFVPKDSDEDEDDRDSVVINKGDDPLLCMQLSDFDKVDPLDDTTAPMLDPAEEPQNTKDPCSHSELSALPESLIDTDPKKKTAGLLAKSLTTRRDSLFSASAFAATLFEHELELEMQKLLDESEAKQKDAVKMALLKKRTVECLESFQSGTNTEGCGVSQVTKLPQPNPPSNMFTLIISSLFALFASAMLDLRITQHLISNIGVFWHIVTIWGVLIALFLPPN